MASRDAPHPFNKPTADAILRTKDGVAFRVHTAILAEASPFFADMFTLPQPSQADPKSSSEGDSERADSLPVIDVTEDSATLEKTLRYCYPGVDNPMLATVGELEVIMEAAKKYQLDSVLIIIMRRFAYFAAEEPLRAFAVAYMREMADETRLAAYQGLRRPMLADGAPEELDRISGRGYYVFIKYHERCQRVATALTTDFRWIPVGTPLGSSDLQGAPIELRWETGRIPKWFSCGSCAAGNRTVTIGEQHTTYTPRAWWLTMMDRARAALEKRPFGGALLQSTLLSPVFQAASACGNCKEYNTLNEFRTFMHFFAAEVDRKTSEVRVFQRSPRSPWLMTVPRRL